MAGVDRGALTATSTAAVSMAKGMLPALASMLALWVCPVLAMAATIVVGKGGYPETFAQAVSQASDGDTIAILPGEYRGDVAVISQKRLTIRGIGSRPVFIADGKAAEDKAIWVIKNGDIVIENVEFREAAVSDLNGAGIRFEKGRLTLRRCGFFGNQNGILTANFADAELTVEDSEFADAQRLSGRNHLLYAGPIRKLVVRGSRFQRGALGHLIKSRARETTIAYNLIADGPSGDASYEVDLPNGGEATLIGNIVAKGPRRSSPVVIAYGAEGTRWDVNSLVLSHNTLVNEGWRPAWFLRVWRDRLPADARIIGVNNLTVGAGLFTLAARGEFQGNWPALRGMFVDPEIYDFAIPSGSWLRELGVRPDAAGVTFVPRFEFRMPVGTVVLEPPASWVPGAIQH